jgi:hypothetical protein
MGFPFTANFPFGLPVLEEVPAGTGGRYVTATLQQCKDILSRTSITLGMDASWVANLVSGTSTCIYHIDASFSFSGQTMALVNNLAQKCFSLCGEPQRTWNPTASILYSQPGGTSVYYTDPPSGGTCLPDYTTDTDVTVSVFDLTAKFYRSASDYKVSLLLSGTITAETIIYFYLFTGPQSAWSDVLYPSSATWLPAGSAVMNGIGLTGIVESPDRSTWTSASDDIHVSLSID